MKQFSKDLGNVSLAPKGKWSREQEYERLALVYNAYNSLSYVAKINVPSGVDIENREYWQPMNATGYSDNNFINLTAENENGTITAYESLEEAVATILPINRRAGATLSFYNLNSDRLDRQAEFELWQFNSTDLANWENKDYWNNIYYNWNVFAGWYIGADALKNHIKIPSIGQYAYVGSNLNDAILYQCRTNGTWTNTGIKVRNYISVVVSGNITIGENGNWFSDGEDTGIPATPSVDEQLDNIIMQLQQHTTEINNLKASYANLQDQITSNDSDITNLTAKHESLSKMVQGIADKNKEQDTSIGNKAEKSEMATELNKKFNKENIAQEFGDSEDKVVSQFALPFRIVENSKYLYAKTDTDGKMLLGFKKNGQPVFGVGVPEQIQEGIDESAENVKSQVDDKINLGSNIYPANIRSVTENNKYKEVVISKDNKILRGINRENEEEIYLPQNFFGTKTTSSIENANYLEILYSRNGRMLSSRDKNGMLTEYGGVNSPFYLKNGVELSTQRYEDTMFVAAKDSDDTDKALADYICDGINDEEEINKAIVALKKRSVLRYKKVVLFSGHYYVDSFPEVLGDWKSAIAFHSDNGMLGDSLTISGISHYYRSTVIYVTEKALNSIVDNIKHSVIMCMPSTKDNSVVRFDVQNIMIALANNQHPIVAVNLQYGDCGECKNIYMTASGLYDNSETGIHTGTSVRDNAVDGVIALRSYHGYTIGDTVRFDNICAFGFYTAFQLGCEHAIYNNLRSRFCHTGYTFGEYHTELVRGAFDHPMTLINCCDEQSIQGPVFAWNGLINKESSNTHNTEDRKLQSVTFIDFNYENPLHKAYEVEPGTFCGLILYHPSDGTFGGIPNYSFWKEGSGKNFTTINLTQANGGTSELRKSYGAHYMQHFFDTDLNKEVIFNGTNWVDCLGNIVQ